MSENENPCPAVMNIKGEHFRCDWPTAPHPGLEAAWAGAEAAGR